VATKSATDRQQTRYVNVKAGLVLALALVYMWVNIMESTPSFAALQPGVFALSSYRSMAGERHLTQRRSRTQRKSISILDAVDRPAHHGAGFSKTRQTILLHIPRPSDFPSPHSMGRRWPKAG
jgi:hypothetical protein